MGQREREKTEGGGKIAVEKVKLCFGFIWPVHASSLHPSQQFRQRPHFHGDHMHIRTCFTFFVRNRTITFHHAHHVVLTFISSSCTVCRFNLPESSQLCSLCGKKNPSACPPLKSSFVWSLHSLLSICNRLVSSWNSSPGNAHFPLRFNCSCDLMFNKISMIEVTVWNLGHVKVELWLPGWVYFEP